MSRSLKKGPFIDGSLVKKIEEMEIRLKIDADLWVNHV